MLHRAAAVAAQVRAVLYRTRNFSIYFVLNVLQRAMGLLLLPLYTAFLVPAEFGIVALSWSFSIVTPLFFLCIPDALYFSALHAKEEEDAYRSAGLRAMLSILGAVFSILLLLYLLDVQGSFAGVPINPYLLLILAINLLQGLVDARLQILQAKQQAGHFFRLGVTRIALQLSTVVTILSFAPSAALLLVGQLGVNLLLALLVAPWIVRSVLAPSKGQLRPCIRFALPLVPHSLAHWARSSLDRILLGQYSGTAAVGKYSIAAALASAMNMVTDAYRNYQVPLQFEWLKDQERNLVSLRFFCIAFLAALAAIAVLIAAGSPLIYWLLVSNPEYKEGQAILPVLLGGAVAYASYITVVSWMFFKEGSHPVAINTTAVSILALPVFWFLIQRYGIYGAAWAQFIAAAGMAAAVFRHSRRYAPFPIPGWPLVVLSALLPAIGAAEIAGINRWPLLVAGFGLCSGILWREYRLWRRGLAA